MLHWSDVMLVDGLHQVRLMLNGLVVGVVTWRKPSTEFPIPMCRDAEGNVGFPHWASLEKLQHPEPFVSLENGKQWVEKNWFEHYNWGWRA